MTTANPSFSRSTSFRDFLGDLVAVPSGDRQNPPARETRISTPRKPAPTPAVKDSSSKRYQILSQIGEGGSAKIFRARDTLLERDVILKRFPPREDGPAGSHPDFESELSALSRLTHPHLVRAYDLGDCEDGPYVILELLTGHPLEGEISQHTSCGFAGVQPFVVQLLQALIAVHDADLCHLDLKPENIMISRLANGFPHYTLLDFGRAADPARLRWRRDNEDKKSLLGSIYYMSPEQLTRGSIDARSDLYSLGIIIYQLLTGKRPFDGPDTIQVMSAHLLHHVTPIRELVPELPTGIGHWLMALLAQNPDVRPASAREALASFLALSPLTHRPIVFTAPFPAM
jgi:serine/threonine-protein kinase